MRAHLLLALKLAAARPRVRADGLSWDHLWRSCATTRWNWPGWTPPFWIAPWPASSLKTSWFGGIPSGCEHDDLHDFIADYHAVEPLPRSTFGEPTWQRAVWEDDFADGGKKGLPGPRHPAAYS